MSNNKVSAVVVTFHPTMNHIQNLEKLRPQVETLVVVDNGSSEQALAELRAACASLDIALLENGVNLGIATALNTGVRWALEHGQKWVVLLDQDSAVTDGFIDCMHRDFAALSTRTNVMQIIPRYRDPETGDEEVIATGPDGGPFITRTSGSFFPVDLFIKCGFFTEELFIYCVDDDFSLRLRSMGFSIAQSKSAVLLHHAGSPTKFTFLGKEFKTRNYRAEVQYYWSRNRIWLVRKYWRRHPHIIFSSLRSLCGIPWKLALGEDNSRRKIRMFMRGIVHGLLGKTGRRVEIR